MNTMISTIKTYKGQTPFCLSICMRALGWGARLELRESTTGPTLRTVFRALSRLGVFSGVTNTSLRVRT
uniref:Uncharacterized protein n=1 Tax=Anguilla anguilla TaxID=7936 RepID=A0A0E9RLN4_ANGAN